MISCCAVFNSLVHRRFNAASLLFQSIKFISTASKVQLPSGISLHIEKAGDGDHCIVCIPGALGTALSDYKPQLEYFGRLESPFTIVAFDPAGYGQSRPPRRVFKNEPIHFLKQDAIDAYKLMQCLNMKTFSVLGWSDGGVAAMFLAGCFPYAVKKLAIWGANGYVTKDDIKAYEETRDIKNWSKRMRDPLDIIYGTDLGPLWSEWIDSMFNNFERGGNLCKDVLPLIQSPTLILHGDKDPLVPSFHPNFLHDNILLSTQYRFPDGKHNIHLKYADKFNTVVEQFLLS